MDFFPYTWLSELVKEEECDRVHIRALAERVLHADKWLQEGGGSDGGRRKDPHRGVCVPLRVRVHAYRTVRRLYCQSLAFFERKIYS